MKQTVRVTPVSPNSLGKHKLIYHDKGEVVFVNKSKELVRIPNKEYSKMYFDKQVQQLDIMTLNLKAAKGKTGDGKVVARPEELILSTNGEVGDKGMIEFFTHYPCSRVDGKNNSPTIFFNVENIAKTKEKRYDTHKIKLEGMAYVDLMDTDEIQEVAVFFGLNTSDKSREELVLELADMQDGQLFKENEQGVLNYELFKQFFIDANDDVKRERDIIVVLNKALKNNVIKKINNTGYYYKETFVGMDKEEILKTLRNDNKVFASLKATMNYSSTKKDDSSLVSATSLPTDSLSKQDLMQKAKHLIKSKQNPDGVEDIGERSIVSLTKEELQGIYDKHLKK